MCRMPPPLSSTPPHSADMAARQQWTDEMFDLTAPAVEKACTARLLALRPALCSVNIAETDVILGRGSALDPAHRIRGCAALSAEHCHITVDPLTKRITVRDVSKNGCFINGKRIAKHVDVELSHGDELSLTKPTSVVSASSLFAADAQDTAHHTNHTSNDEDNNSNTKKKGLDAQGTSEVVYLFQRIQPERSLDVVLDEIRCVLCGGVYYHPCTLAPCRHACCASCLSQRMSAQTESTSNNNKSNSAAKEGNVDSTSHNNAETEKEMDIQGAKNKAGLHTYRLTCPTCEAVVCDIRPSARLSQLAELVQQRCTQYALSAQERMRRDAEDCIPATGMTLLTCEDDTGGDAYEHHSLHDSDEDDDGGHVGDKRSAAQTEAPLCTVSNEPVKHARLRYHENFNEYNDKDNTQHHTGHCMRGWSMPRMTGLLCRPHSRRLCRHCLQPSCIDGFHCRAGMSHVVCTACDGLIPHRPLLAMLDKSNGRPTRCPGCHAVYCNLYYAAERGEGGCPAQTHPQPTQFQALRSFVFTELPAMTFAGNTIEQAILKSYLLRRATSLQAVYQDCLDQLDAGRWRMDSFVSLSLGAVHSQTAFCVRCATRIFADLLLHYRMAIPRHELPDAVSARQNCWHGKECALQLQTREHALQYSHVCYQQKGKE